MSMGMSSGMSSGMSGGAREGGSGGGELVALLDRQIGLLEELDRAVAMQENWTGEEDADEIAAVMSRREELIGLMTAVDASLGEARRGWDGSAGGRALVDERVERVGAMAARIMERDRELMPALVERLRAIGQELSQMSQATAAAGAYARQAGRGVSPAFQDREI